MEEFQGRSQLLVSAFFVVVLTAVYIVLLARRKAKNAKRLPPGPKGWPIIGSLPSISTLPHRSFSKLSEQYGPIMYLRMGSLPSVVLSSPAMAKEVLQTQDHIWCSRQATIISTHHTYEQRDIAFAPYGPSWRAARKVCTLELLAPVHMAHFQGVREGEALAFMKSAVEASKQGKALNVQEVLVSMMTNIMTKIMWNKRHFDGFSPSPETIEFQNIVRENGILLGAINFADYIPALKPVTMRLQGYDKRMRVMHQNFDKFVEKIIDEHREKLATSTGSEGTQNDDFVNLLLQPSKSLQSDGNEVLPMDTVKAILLDMLLAGTDTISTTLEWAFAEMLRNPKMLSRVQDELNSVVGPNRLVSEADIPNLKYIQAVLKETFRLHPAVPMLIPHKSMQDCEIAGYHIPAGTQAIINVWSIQRDPAVWERPLEFDPDRFLESTMDVKGRDFELLPFGTGRRMCPAANVALITVQYFFSQLWHCFTWSLEGDVEGLDMTESFGITAPRKTPLSLLATPRLGLDIICPSG